MIVKLEPDLLEEENPEVLRELAKFIDLFLDDKLLWDTSNLPDFDKLIPKTRLFLDFLSRDIQEHLIRIVEQKSSYLTEIQLIHFSLIEVGKNSKLKIRDINAIHEKPATIVLENSVNDFMFIECLARIYQGHKKRRSIYRSIMKAIENQHLIPTHAGGKGDILSRVSELERRYSNNYLRRVALVFDSDKKSPDDSAKDTQRIIIQSLKGRADICDYWECGDKVYWHMLFKREMENYLPLSVIGQQFPVLADKCEELSKKTKSEIDFVKFADYFKGTNVKQLFPSVFKNPLCTREELEANCSDYKAQWPINSRGILECVNEYEDILIKIARII